jgi:dynein light chain 1, axonemal
MIEKMFPLSGMTKLEILSLARNKLRKIEKLEDVADTLEQLWLSYNEISTLDGLGGLNNLQVLYLSNNQIKEWPELFKLVGTSSPTSMEHRSGVTPLLPFPFPAG